MNKNLLNWVCLSTFMSCTVLFHVLSSAVNCGDPGTPSNGRRTGSSTTYNSVVTYTCNTGYRLEGSSSRTCQSNGQWSGSLPRCNCKFCFVLVVFYIVSTYIVSLFPDIYIIHSNSPCENSSPCTAGDLSVSLLSTIFLILATAVKGSLFH